MPQTTSESSSLQEPHSIQIIFLFFIVFFKTVEKNKKHREVQGELHCVWVDLEKAYNRVPQEELWYCMRKSGIVEKYVQLVQNMYEESETVVKCAVGTTESFKVKVGLHQGSVLSPFLFAVIMDRLTDEVRRELLWKMLFADDIVICEETRKEVEQRLESWRYALERREMKIRGQRLNICA